MKRMENKIKNKYFCGAYKQGNKDTTHKNKDPKWLRTII